MPRRERDVIRALIPGVCHPVASETLSRLRRAGEDEFYIVGVDFEERGKDYNGVDAHYFVPPATSPEYPRAVLDIALQEHVDIVVPWSDDEVAAIAAFSGAFREHGIATLCGSFESVGRTLHKGTTLEGLAQNGVAVPEFEVVSSSEQIDRAAKKMGYPREKVVVKPCRGSGGRGLWILDSETDMLRYTHGPGRRATLPALLFMVRESEKAGKAVPEHVVMPFLPGDDYSVDALANEGKAVFVLPRRRMKAVEGISHVAEIRDNPEVRAMVARVVETFNLHLNVNVQLKYSKVSGGEPLVYEVNPRISGTIVANDAAGVSLLYYGVQLALGRPIPDRDSLRARETRMFRTWVGRYTYTDEWFIP